MACIGGSSAASARTAVLRRLEADGTVLAPDERVSAAEALTAVMLPSEYVGAAGLPKADHAQIYLPAVVASLLVMGGVLFPMERRGRLRAAFLIAIALIGAVQFALWALAGASPGLWTLGLLLFVFFVGFNTLEASQPSLVSKLAPAHARGAALGVYNTLQSVGFFVGGAVGGWLAPDAALAPRAETRRRDAALDDVEREIERHRSRDGRQDVVDVRPADERGAHVHAASRRAHVEREAVERVRQRTRLDVGGLADAGKVGLLAIEGELDDISGVGQTEAAQRICKGLSKDMRRHYVQKGVGHYGIFNGRKFREHVVPIIVDFIGKMER